MNKPRVVPVVIAILLGPVAVLAARQAMAGSLDPPGPPAPTMKTLDEVAPYIPIHAASLPYGISQPGSYYLADDAPAAAGGITIYTGGVTLDLRGHTLAGTSGTGIFVNLNVGNVEIRNGVVSGWSTAGIDAVSADHVRVIDVRATGTTAGTGIQLGPHGIVQRCAAVGNAVYGIAVQDGGTVIDSVATGNTLDGIRAATSASIRGCSASGNGRYGIIGDEGSVIESCTANANVARGINGIGAEIVRSAAYQNQSDGIYVDGGTVRDSLAEGNAQAGILSIGNSTIAGNFARANQVSGIRADGSGNRLDGNSSVNNTSYGIYVTATGNTIVRNYVRGSLINYQIVAGNEAGPIGGASAATSPWANLQN